MPRRAFSTIRLLAASAAIALALTGCSNGGQKDEEDQEGQSVPAGDRALTVNTSFVISGLDPGSVYEGTGNMVVHALYETLTTFEGDDLSEPVGLLAESYESSDDAMTHTFTLRDGLTFSDGSELTSEDVVFSLNRLKNLQGSPSANVAALTFEAPDERTIVVTSEEADPNVPTILAMPSTGIVNSEAVMAEGGTDAEDAATSDSAASAFNSTSFGSGPYVLESLDAASRVVLSPNENYWGEAAPFGRIVVQNMDVQTQRLTMERSPELTVALDLAGDAVEGLPQSLQQTSSQDTYYLVRLSADPEVDDLAANVDFVAALRASLDYEGIAALFGESAVPAAGMVPTAYAGSLPEDEAPTQDLELSQQILSGAGLEDPQISLLYPAITYRGVDLGTVAAKVQADARQAGISIELDPAPLSTFLDRRRSGNVPMSLSPQSFDLPIAAQIVPDVMPGGGTAGFIGWTEERAEPAVLEAAAAVSAAESPDAQVAALQDWQRAMNESSPYITLCHSAGTVVASDDLDNALYTSAGWILDLTDIGPR